MITFSFVRCTINTALSTAPIARLAEVMKRTTAEAKAAISPVIADYLEPD